MLHVAVFRARIVRTKLRRPRPPVRRRTVRRRIRCIVGFLHNLPAARLTARSSILSRKRRRDDHRQL